MNGDDARHGREGVGGTPGGDLSGRLERLGTELKAKRPASPAAQSGGSSPSDPTAFGRAFRASTEFIAGIIAGGILGWLWDWGLGTKPWGLIVLLLLGFVAGIFNVLRTAGMPAPTGAGSSRDEP